MTIFHNESAYFQVLTLISTTCWSVLILHVTRSKIPRPGYSYMSQFFHEKLYKQLSGASMCFLLSPVVADNFMGIFGEIALQSLHSIQKFGFGILMILSSFNLMIWILSTYSSKHLCKIKQLSSIRWCTVISLNQGRLGHLVNRESMHKNRYLLAESYHRPVQKLWEVGSLVNRAVCLPKLNNFQIELQHRKKSLQNNGYKTKIYFVLLFVV